MDELDRDYTSADVTAVVSQLLRSAVAEELKNVERDMRAGIIGPEVAMATITDVKERISLLETSHGDVAEHDLRVWLQSRNHSTTT